MNAEFNKTFQKNMDMPICRPRTDVGGSMSPKQEPLDCYGPTCTCGRTWLQHATYSPDKWAVRVRDRIATLAECATMLRKYRDDS